MFQNLNKMNGLKICPDYSAHNFQKVNIKVGFVIGACVSLNSKNLLITIELIVRILISEEQFSRKIKINY